MASEISKRIDEVIKLGIAPLLKEHGFSKRRRNFHKAVGEAIQVVNIQADRYNEGNAGKFTINVGIYFRSVAEIAERSIVGGAPNIYECTIVARLGHLMPNSEDKWWSLGVATDDRQIAYSAAADLETYGLPKLVSSSTREGLRDCFDIEPMNFTFHPLSRIALEILDGNTAQAATLLRARLKIGAGSHDFISRMTEWGRKRGLL